MKIPRTERVPNNEVLRRMGEKKMLIASIVETRSNIIGFLLRHSNWFSTLIEGMIKGRSGRASPRQEYVDGVKGGTSDVVIKRVYTERKKLQVHQSLG